MVYLVHYKRLEELKESRESVTNILRKVSCIHLFVRTVEPLRELSGELMITTIENMDLGYFRLNQLNKCDIILTEGLSLFVRNSNERLLRVLKDHTFTFIQRRKTNWHTYKRSTQKSKPIIYYFYCHCYKSEQRSWHDSYNCTT